MVSVFWLLRSLSRLLLLFVTTLGRPAGTAGVRASTTAGALRVPGYFSVTGRNATGEVLHHNHSADSHAA